MSWPIVAQRRLSPVRGATVTTRHHVGPDAQAPVPGGRLHRCNLGVTSFSPDFIGNCAHRLHVTPKSTHLHGRSTLLYGSGIPQSKVLARIMTPCFGVTCNLREQTPGVIEFFVVTPKLHRCNRFNVEAAQTPDSIEIHLFSRLFPTCERLVENSNKPLIMLSFLRCNQNLRGGVSRA